MINNPSLDYEAFYKEQANFAKEHWRDKGKPELSADLWYNKERNRLCLEMIGNVCKDKEVLSIGAREWPEAEFLQELGAKNIIKTDLIPDTENNILGADAQELPFPDESFDFISCRDVIEHVKDAQAVFSEIRRVLRTAGYLIITTPNLYNFGMDGRLHVRGYTPNTFLKEIEDFGFHVKDKRGNCPNIMTPCGLIELYRKGLRQVLEEYQEIAEKIEMFPDSYYIGTQLFVLAQKVGAV